MAHYVPGWACEGAIETITPQIAQSGNRGLLSPSPPHRPASAWADRALHRAYRVRRRRNNECTPQFLDGDQPLFLQTVCHDSARGSLLEKRDDFSYVVCNQLMPEGSNMTTITVQLDDSKAALLREKAQKYGLPLDQFVTASIEDLIAQPEPEFDAAVRRVLSKNKELYERLA